MKKILYILIALVILFFIGAGITFYVFETKIKGQILPKAKDFIRKQSNLDIDFEKVRFSFSRLIQLEPALKIEKLKIGDAVYIELAVVELYLKSFLKKKIDIKQILLDRVRLNLSENAKKEVVLKGLGAKTQAKKTKAKAKTAKKSELVIENDIASNLITDIHLQKFIVKDSTLNFYPYGQTKPLSLTDVDIKVTDFAYGENQEMTSNLVMSADLFHQPRSSLNVNAKLGPFASDFHSIPISGSERFSFYLSDMPAHLQEELLGEKIILNNDTAFKQKSNFRGDILKSLSGEGSLDIENLVVGNSRKHSLTTDSTIPLNFWLRLNKNPHLKLQSKDATLDISSKDNKHGQLNFNSDLDISIDNQMITGSSSGTLNGLELLETLNSLTPHKDLISGVFEVNNYNVSFSGKNADELGKSFKASGSVKVHDGSLYLLKTLNKYDDIASLFFKGDKKFSDKISGKFISLGSDFALRKGNLFTENIDLVTPKAKITGGGVMKKGKYLKYKIFLDLKNLSTIPVAISGTVKKPSIKPDLKAIGQQRTEDLVDTILDIGLKGINREGSPTVEPEAKSPNTNSEVESSTPKAENKPKEQSQKPQSKEELLQNLLQFGLDTLEKEIERKTKD